MKTGDKTPQQLMEDFKMGNPMFIDSNPVEPDFHTMALLVAQTVPSGSIQELLSNAEKIEYWLNEPRRKSEEFDKMLREGFEKS